MLVAMIYIHVKPESVDAFRQASIENAKNSIREPGIARFDLIQQADDPTRFMLVEVYRDTDGPARHRETAHYKTWREGVEPMMAEPRMRTVYQSVYPDEAGWG